MMRFHYTCSLPFFLLLLLLPAAVAFADEAPGQTIEDSDEEQDGDDDDDDDDSDDGEKPPWAQAEGDGDEGDAEGGESGEQPADGESTTADSDGTAAAGDQEQTSTAASGSWKSGGVFGLGFIVGTDNGLSLKLWPSRMHGIHIHIAAPLRLNALSVGFAYQVHLAAISIPGSPVQLHPSIGPSFRLRTFFYGDGTYVDGHGGASLGMSVTVAGAPAEIFFEVVPGVAFGINIPGVGIGFDVGGHVGARFYFGS